MHDQCTMRRFDGTANADEQLQSLTQIQPPPARMKSDRFAVDEFECDVGNSGFRNVAFDQPRDAGMTQLCEREPFAAEVALLLVGVQSAAQELERHGLTHAGLFAFGTKYDRRAAFAEFFEQRERTDSRT